MKRRAFLAGLGLAPVGLVARPLSDLKTNTAPAMIGERGPETIMTSRDVEHLLDRVPPEWLLQHRDWLERHG